nr:MAG TPA: hypothetical protein [Bacteriophage sp.]
MISITKEDLIGQIASFPLKVVEAMVANQVRQGNPANVKVFQEKVDASFVEGGFSWNKSTEGQFFWSKVINGKQFPKEIVPPDKSIEPVKPEEPVNESPEEVDKSGKESLTYYKIGDVIRVKVGSNTRSRVIIGYFPDMPNPYLTITEDSFKDFMNGKTSCHINVTAIEEPKKYVYLTLKDISEGKDVGIDPDLIKIVQ